MKKTLNPAMLLTLAAAAFSPTSLAASASRTVGGKGRRKRDAMYWKPNGARECARRRRQIGLHILREENGLLRGART